MWENIGFASGHLRCLFALRERLENVPLLIAGVMANLPGHYQNAKVQQQLGQ